MARGLMRMSVAATGLSLIHICKLAGLAQRLFGGELVTIAEQLVHIIAGKVDVPHRDCLLYTSRCV